MVSLGYASLFSRSPRTGVSLTRWRHVAPAGCDDLQDQPLDAQALASPPRWRPASGSSTSERSYLHAQPDRPGRVADTSPSVIRRLDRRPYAMVERFSSRADGLSQDDRARDCAPWLDAQKKTIRASERDEAARQAF